MGIFEELEDLERRAQSKKSEKGEENREETSNEDNKKEKFNSDFIPEDFRNKKNAKKESEEDEENVDPETGEILTKEKSKDFLSQSVENISKGFKKDENIDVNPDDLSPPHIQVNPDGPFLTEQDQFLLSSTLIRNITDQHGNVKDYCPRNIYHLYIKKDYSLKKKVFSYGDYGEYIALGGGAYETVTDLPKHKKTGKKLVTQRRIEEQMKIHFPRIYNQLFSGMIIPFYNTQIPVYKYYKKYDIIVRSVLDHFPAITFLDGNEPKLAIMDLKLTADVHSTFGMGWGDPDKMDNLQPDLYLRQLKDFDMDLNKKMDPVFDKNVGYEKIFTDVVRKFIEDEKITFVNMVFSYNKTDPDNGFKKTIRSYRDITNPFSDDRTLMVNERIRKTLAHLSEMKENGFQPIPNADICKDCPVKKLLSGKGDGYCEEYHKLDIS